MGAMLWHHRTPWEPDASSALKRLQTALFLTRYDYSTYVEEQRAEVAGQLQAEKESGDKYRLVEVWSESLKKIDRIRQQPTPATTYDQFLAVRTIIPEEFGGVLDVTATSDIAGIHLMRLLSANEIEAVIGTTTPTMQQAEASLYRLTETLDRGESVAFAVFDGFKNPVAWQFIGLTVD